MSRTIGLGAGDALQVDLRGDRARALFGAREREELVREARSADGRAMHLLELCTACLRHRLRQRELGMRLQAGERRAQLVRRIREEALLQMAGRGDFLQQTVQRADQRPRLLRGAAGVDRPQVTRRARLDLVGKLRERLQPALDAEPHDDERGERDQQLRKEALQQDVAREPIALHHGLGDEHGAGGPAAGRLHRDHAHVLAVVTRVVRHRVAGRGRQVRVTRNLQTGGAHHTVIDAVEAVGAQHLLDRPRQLEAVLGLSDADMRAEREANVDQRLVVGLGGRLERRVISGDGAEREQRHDRREQHAQQVRSKTLRSYLYSSSM
jgi:hypothetical protein